MAADHKLLEDPLRKASNDGFIECNESESPTFFTFVAHWNKLGQVSSLLPSSFKPVLLSARQSFQRTMYTHTTLITDKLSHNYSKHVHTTIYTAFHFVVTSAGDQVTYETAQPPRPFSQPCMRAYNSLRLPPMFIIM